MRTLNKRLNGVAPKPVSGYISGVTEYLEADNGAAATSFDIDAAIGAAWESVGPTGSGATNIWTAMDSIPSGAKWVELKITQDYYIGSDATSLVSSQISEIYMRVTGSSTSIGADTVKSRIRLTLGINGLRVADLATVKIPLDSSNRFDIYWSTGATPADFTNYMNVLGWGI